MRLVGTSNTVIRLPFIFEGLFLGMIGSIIPMLATIYGYVFLYEKMGGVLGKEDYLEIGNIKYKTISYTYNLK